MERLSIAALVLFAVLAGCTTGAEETANNPWGTQNVTVGINDVHGVAEEQHVQMVGKAIDYWGAEGSEYRKYEANLVFEPDADAPDIEVQFVPWHPNCSYESPDINSDVATRSPTYAGCAPVLNSSTTAPELVTVEVSTRVPDNQIAVVLKHEFGHIFGLGHNEGPEDIMSPTIKIPEG